VVITVVGIEELHRLAYPWLKGDTGVPVKLVLSNATESFELPSLNDPSPTSLTFKAEGILWSVGSNPKTFAAAIVAGSERVPLANDIIVGPAPASP
jgi:hypothetical protein